MKIAIVGTGYVGLVSGACFAEMGIDVTCVDIDSVKIKNLINGIIPIYEPGLEQIVKRNVAEGRLHFTTDLADCIDGVSAVFCAVGTPPDEDGSADLKYVREVAATFGRLINHYTIFVTKSTVPVGTSSIVREVIAGELAKRGADIPFEVASNPEFLKEGAAIKDFMSPDRVVIGVESQRARKVMEKLYRPFLLNNFGIHIHGFALAVDEHRRRALIAYWIGACRECKILANHFIAGLHTKHHKSEVYSGRAGTERHYLMVAANKMFEAALKLINIRSEGHKPVVAICFFNPFHFASAFLRQRKLNPLLHNL